MFSANDCHDPPCSLLRFMDIFRDVPREVALDVHLKVFLDDPLWSSDSFWASSFDHRALEYFLRSYYSCVLTS